MKATPVYPFQANPGVLIKTEENLQPNFFFEVFLNDEVIEFFVAETNSYAEKVCQNMVIKRSSLFRKWEPTNATEMRVFVGLVLHMGVINLPRLSDYWSNDPMYKTYLRSKYMSRNRFYLLLHFWHFEINGNNERLNKIEFLMNHWNNTMKRIYCPNENFSLDESVVLWRRRTIFRQYIKGKKHKCGVKFYELCESDGLILRSFIYSGLPYPDTHDLGQTGAIVLKLMEDFLGRGYSVFADIFYNSVKLAKHLSKQKTYICGTLRGNRKGNSKNILKNNLKIKKVCVERSDDIVVCKLKDKRDVLTISNKHSVEMVPVPNKRGQLTIKPNIVSDYNDSMSGVDRFNQMLSYNQGLRKCIRWCSFIGVHFIDIFLHNSVLKNES